MNGVTFTYSDTCVTETSLTEMAHSLKEHITKYKRISYEARLKKKTKVNLRTSTRTVFTYLPVLSNNGKEIISA